MTIRYFAASSNERVEAGGNPHALRFDDYDKCADATIKAAATYMADRVIYREQIDKVAFVKMNCNVTVEPINEQG